MLRGNIVVKAAHRNVRVPNGRMASDQANASRRRSGRPGLKSARNRPRRPEPSDAASARPLKVQKPFALGHGGHDAGRWTVTRSRLPPAPSMPPPPPRPSMLWSLPTVSHPTQTPGSGREGAAPPSAPPAHKARWWTRSKSSSVTGDGRQAIPLLTMGRSWLVIALSIDAFRVVSKLVSESV